MSFFEHFLSPKPSAYVSGTITQNELF